VILANKVPAVPGEKSVVAVVQRERKVTAAVLISNQPAVEMRNEAFTRDSFAPKLKSCGLAVGQRAEIGDFFS
jgi:hypothetical protein